VSLILTPENLATAYDYLRSTQPFSRWNLPDSEDVVFRVGRAPRSFGWYQWDGGRHTITASEKAIGHTSTLMLIMAHEMVHLHLEATGMESRTGDTSIHNAAFRKCAAQVCRFHGFDPKAFY